MTAAAAIAAAARPPVLRIRIDSKPFGGPFSRGLADGHFHADQ
jgi:hypothetical protein